jgi:hypothetical protein
LGESVHSWLELLFNRILGRKYSTEGFFGREGNFLQKDALLGLVFSALPRENVEAIYLIGSVLDLKGKELAHFQPRDIDVFVQVKCESRELENCRKRFGNNALSINGQSYPVHWIVYNCDPFDVYEMYDKLKFCYRKHRLYP